MASNSPHLEPFKTKKIIHRIRESIVSGQYSPGYRLPTFVEMEGDFEVGRAVLQHAIAALKRDGFVRSEGRRGLYVTEHPPHLFQYGLVMPSAPGAPGWCHLMTAINNEVHRIEKADADRRFRFYYGVEPGEDAVKPLNELRDDVQNARLAGLIVHHACTELVNSVLPEGVRLPRLYLWADQQSTVQPCLTVDGGKLILRALELLKSRGRKRVALLQMSGTGGDFDYRRAYESQGLEYHAPWVQWVSRSQPQAAEHLVALLLDYRREERPDALIITDDNLVPFVSRGVLASGVGIGEELELVCHCNWPWPPQSVLPMIRIGFDMRQVMSQAMRTLILQQRGETPEPYQRVAPRFEWELDHINP